MRIGLSLPIEERLHAPRLVALAREAEVLGYDTVIVGEAGGAEAFSTLGAVGMATHSVQLMTGIVPIANRSPVLAAMGFATLASLFPGRVVAGVGVSSPIVAGWHERDFPPPLTAAREFVPKLQKLLRGELRPGGFRLGMPFQGEIPVVMAAMNPGMLRLAGQLADGVNIAWTPPDELPAKVALVREGAESVGRDPDAVLVIASVLGYDGPDPDRALERLRRMVLAYSMVPTHQSAFVQSIASLSAVQRAWDSGDRAAALSLVDDRAVRRLCAIGDGRAVARRLDELDQAGADLAVILPVGGALGDEPGLRSTVRCAVGAAQAGAGAHVDGPRNDR
jgi:alkanesulfonate monooxygenase SsuD/methylene tetrahydromethanopterin reductase-like flavin-dependent oxidoreductase (luciferase family)